MLASFEPSRAKSLICAGLALLSAPGFAQDRGRGWGPEQATGEANTVSAGDFRTAWASASEDDSDEWLELDFATPVVPSGLRVFESFNPGALVAVSLFSADGVEVEVWRGVDPTPRQSASGVSLVPLVTQHETSRLRLHLASRSVPGWNEIDAVGLHGPTGRLQWAVAARASSSFASGEAPPAREPAITSMLALDELGPGATSAADELFEVFVELKSVGGSPAALETLARQLLVQQNPALRPRAEGFEGSWKTSFGELVIRVEGDSAHGSYPLGTIEGVVAGRRLSFRYEEGPVAGEGVFELSADGLRFDGRWRPDDREASTEEDWLAWSGRRPDASGGTWLIVLESAWASGMKPEEFSFGQMLRSIFEHASDVEFRQRYVSDAASFATYCAEAARLPGRVVLVVATHGSKRGLYASSGEISGDEIAAALAQMPNLQTVHFSSCAVMGGDIPAKILAARSAADGFEGVSGYTRPVDWMGSALCEFAYLELILGRGLGAAAAAEQLPELLPFVGRRAPGGSPIPALHFRFLAPTKAPRSEAPAEH